MNYGLNKGKNIRMFLFILPALAFFTVIKLIPAVMGIVYSFTNWNGINPTKKFIGIENFKELFASDPDFWVSMEI